MYIDPTGHWQVGDSVKEDWMQAIILEATREYYESQKNKDSKGMERAYRKAEDARNGKTPMPKRIGIKASDLYYALSMLDNNQVSKEAKQDLKSSRISDYPYHLYVKMKSTNNVSANSKINASGEKVFTGMDVYNAMVEINKYLSKSQKDFISGKFSKDRTMLATFWDLGLAASGADLPADIRDLAADLYNWEWTWSHAGETALDGLGVLPLVSLVKYGDEIGDTYKFAKNGLSKIDDYSDIIRKALAKGDDISDADKCISIIWGSIDNLIDSAKYSLKGNNTAVGRAFQKHAIREGTAFIGEITGNPIKNTEQGMYYLNKILNDTNATFIIRNTKAHGDVLDVRLLDGMGARWSADGKTFIGFLERFTIK